MEITVRDLQTLRDYRACEAMQRATWGQDFEEVVPAAIQKISQKVGGVAAGAFAPDGTMVGFVFGITGWKDGLPRHWSHMLAIDPSHRDQGLGQRLKQFQRDQLLKAGVRVMSWTFDPLVARNAHLNICKLGVTIAEYVPDMYGADDENSLDQIIGTDRFIVDWLLDAPTPRTTQAHEGAPLVNATFDDHNSLRPIERDLPSHQTIRIGIPEDIHALKEQSPAMATQWRANTRRAFLHYLGAGYGVTGFATSTEGHAGFYILDNRAS